MQDDQDCLIRGYDIHQKFHPFTFFNHDRSFVCKSNENQTVCAIYL